MSVAHGHTRSLPGRKKRNTHNNNVDYINDSSSSSKSRGRAYDDDGFYDFVNKRSSSANSSSLRVCSLIGQELLTPTKLRLDRRHLKPSSSTPSLLPPAAETHAAAAASHVADDQRHHRVGTSSRKRNDADRDSGGRKNASPSAAADKERRPGDVDRPLIDFQSNERDHQ